MHTESLKKIENKQTNKPWSVLIRNILPGGNSSSVNGKLQNKQLRFDLGNVLNSVTLILTNQALEF